MTDEMTKLRAEIAQLKRQLLLRDAKADRDPRRGALLDAGVPIDRLDDAAACFRPSGDATRNTWKLGNKIGTVEDLARSWLSSRPWFGDVAPEETEKPVWPTDAFGNRIPMHELTTDELARLAGETPEPKPQEAPTYSQAELDAMLPLDRAAAIAAMAGEPEPTPLSYEGMPTLEETREKMKVEKDLRDEQIEHMKQGGMKFKEN